MPAPLESELVREVRATIHYVSALRRALADKPRWDYSDWTYPTMMACSSEEQAEIFEYQLDLQR